LSSLKIFIFFKWNKDIKNLINHTKAIRKKYKTIKEAIIIIIEILSGNKAIEKNKRKGRIKYFINFFKKDLSISFLGIITCFLP